MPTPVPPSINAPVSALSSNAGGLSIGQIIPARVISPDDLKKMVSDARQVVVDTSLGLVGIKPENDSPSRPLASIVTELGQSLAGKPSQATPQTTPGTAPPGSPALNTAASPSKLVLALQVLSLQPSLRLKIIGAVETRDGVSVPLPKTMENRELVAEILPRALRSQLVTPTESLSPAQEKLVLKSAAAMLRVSQAPASDISVNAPRGNARTTVTDPTGPLREKSIETEIHQILKQLLPRQLETRAGLAELLRLLPRLPLSTQRHAPSAPLSDTDPTSVPGAAKTSPESHAADLNPPQLVLAGQLLRQALSSLPEARQLSRPDGLSRLLAQLMGRSAAVVDVARVSLPETDEARATTPSPPSTISSPSGTSERTPTPPSGGRPGMTPTHSNAERPVSWPQIARALRVLSQPLASPSPAVREGQAIQGQTASMQTIQTGTMLQSLMRLIASGSQSLPQPEFEDKTANTALAGRESPRISIPGLNPNERELLQKVAGLLEGLSARTQIQQFQNAQPTGGNPGVQVWQWEIPVRSERRFDVIELRVEERLDKAQEKSASSAYWSISLQFDFPGLGPFRSVVQCQQSQISTRFFASQPATVAFINQEMSWLDDALRSLGLEFTLHACERSDLQPPKNPGTSPLLDVSV